MIQTELVFTSPSPINKIKLSGQNLALYNWLKQGNKIHCYSQARRDLKIGYLNSRISDLINKHNITIYKRGKKVVDYFGDLTDVVEYSLKPFND